MRRLALAALFYAIASNSAPASEPERFGFGMRSPAMAGTGTATADDYEATYENPAGLAFSPHRRLTIGYVLFFIVHIVQVVRAGWNNFRAMVTGVEVVKVTYDIPDAAPDDGAAPVAAQPAAVDAPSG